MWKLKKIIRNEQVEPYYNIISSINDGAISLENLVDLFPFEERKFSGLGGLITHNI